MNMLEDDLGQLKMDSSDGGAWFRVNREVRHASLSSEVLREVAGLLESLSPISVYGRMARRDALVTIKERLDKAELRAAERDAAERDAAAQEEQKVEL